MGKKNSLLLFTASFPYGNKSETFLETEITFLAQHFEYIYIIPAYKESEQIRPIPQNATLVNIILDRTKKTGKQTLFANLGRIFSVYFFSLISSVTNFTFYTKYLKYYLPRLIGEVEYLESITAFIERNQLKEAVFYTYWFEYFLTGLSILKKEGKIKHLYSRAHRFDLYDEINKGLPISFRDFKLKHVDKVFCISQHGQHYLHSKIIESLHNKVDISYLGVYASANTTSPTEQPTPLIVSTSSMIPFKRVDLIARALRRIATPIRWVHFGNGSEYGNVEAICKTFPPHISWTLAGHVDNSAVLSFYKENHVNLFINLSESEGLPVSMMEVLSFGIPIIACDVCGIPEIVRNEKTGVLLSVNEKEETISRKIEDALAFPFNRKEIVSFFNANFEATKNYTSFAKSIQNEETI